MQYDSRYFSYSMFWTYTQATNCITVQQRFQAAKQNWDKEWLGIRYPSWQGGSYSKFKSYHVAVKVKVTERVCSRMAVRFCFLHVYEWRDIFKFLLFSWLSSLTCCCKIPLSMKMSQLIISPLPLATKQVTKAIRSSRILPFPSYTHIFFSLR